MNHMDEWLREEEQPVPMARAFDLTPGKIAP